MKKIILTFLLVLVALVIFTSCAKVIENSEFETDGYIISNGKEVTPEYVLKINGEKVSFAEYRYYYLNKKAELDGGNDSVWKDYPEYVTLLKKDVEDILLEIYSIRQLAAENGVEPDFEKVREEIAEYKSSMSASDYKKGLKSFYLTEELYEYVLQGYDLYTTLFNHFFTGDGSWVMNDAELKEYLEENFVHAKHILIYSNTTMSDEDYEDYLQEVLEEAKSTENFDDVIAKYSNDTAMPSYGYYVTDGEMPEEFMDTCRALEEGEVSDLVKSSYGYHVIKRLPIEEEDLSKLADVVYNHIFEVMINEKIETAEIEYAPIYMDVTPTGVK